MYFLICLYRSKSNKVYVRSFVLTGVGYLVVAGRRGSWGGSEQDEIDRVQITTIQKTTVFPWDTVNKDAL